ncbi:LANO_0H04918g1_1 [Lachancea nothofagi CBS 11611]|uniref:Structure-specific endonuclease subunit SLX4 n=1 Tax=Lachancea nothofagi CBS 11611 TaxID=1266666 RepID=A0A1G4KL71_9SACH|nr:LANO_0H04918g1_1 [Lachancea nothofagi CBS 11611]
MDFDAAQRCLKLAAGVAGEEGDTQETDGESYLDEHREFPMTQIPNDSSANVLISTQIQSKLDDIELQNGLRNSVSQFAFNTPTLPTQARKTAPKREKSKANTVRKARTGKKRKKSTDAIKSITQYNTERFGAIRGQRRTKHVMSLLSGKHGKIKDIVDTLETDTRSITKLKTDTQFSTYNAQEWSHILQLLSSRFPRCPESQVKAVFDYVYGESDENHIWYASQLPPPDSQNEESRSSHVVPDSPLVFTLSQAVEECNSNEPRSNGNSHHSATNSQTDPQGDLQCISNTTDELDSEIHINDDMARAFKAQMLRSATPSPAGSSQIPNSADSPDIVHRELSPFDFTRPPRLAKSESTILPAPLPSTKLEESFKSPSTVSYTRISPSRLAGRDQLIDLTQESFNVVTSLTSVIKHDLQVPATRTTTLNDKVIFSNSTNNHLLNPNIHAPLDELHFRICRNINAADVFASLREIRVAQWEVLSSQNNDSEEEENEYDILRVTFDPRISRISLKPPASVAANSVNEDLVFTGETQPLKEIVGRSPSLPASLPPSAQNLRRNLRAIGFKPKRTRSEMLDQLESASQQLKGTTEEQQRQEIFDDLTAVVEKSPSLLERVYTFEPVVFTELKRFLAEKHPLVLNLEESTIREWADRMGICLRSANDGQQ